MVLLAERLELVASISREALRQALRKVRHTYRRIQEFTPSPDPDYKHKKRLRDFALRQASRRGWVVLFQDETGNFAVKPRTGYCWMAATLRKTVPRVEEKRRRVGVYGTFDALRKQVCWRCTTARTAQTTIDFLETVAEHYRSQKYLVIIWDNAPGHTAMATRHWVEKWNQRAHERGLPKIILLYLPVKAPWLNQIEPVWWGMFRSVIAGQTFSSPRQMEQAIDEYFLGRNQRLCHSPL